MENFNGNAEVEEMPKISTPVKNTKDDRKKLIIGVLTIMGILGVFFLLTGKKKKETKRVRVIKKTKTVIKNKKGAIDEEIDEETDDNETDDNGDTDDNDNGDTDDNDTDDGK